MQHHRHTLEIDATPEEAWAVLHPPPPRRNADGRRLLVHGDVSIEVLHDGDDHGQGLVRTCTFQVPKWLLTGGVGRSWETIVESRPYEEVRYMAVGRPLWSKAEGAHLFEEIGSGRTRITFEESYEAFNRVSGRLLEKRVHEFISRDNEQLIRQALDRGISRLRKKRA